MKPGRRQGFLKMPASEFQRLALERDIRTAIIEYLSLVGIEATITDAALAYGPDGKLRVSKVKKSWPDISGVLPGGRALFIECKTTGGRYQPGQKEMLERLRQAGAVVIEGATSVEDVKAILFKGDEVKR